MSDTTASKLGPKLPTTGSASEGADHPVDDGLGQSSAAGGPSSGSTTAKRSLLIGSDRVSADDATVISDRAPAVRDSAGTGTSPTDLGRMLEGERLDHFELDQFIGGGGMGAVFRGSDTALGRTVAIKVLLRQYGSDEETIRRFQNEAQSAARLDHDNIARVYYVGEDRGWHYIVLEYIEGDNIRDIVFRQGPLSLQDTVSYTLQIADALEHASSRDVVHRDIKPSNVLIGPDGRAKLVDMGLARLHQVEQSRDDLTASGVTLGTFDYISPEQARDPRVADVRSDLYSLGCTLYFMLTRQPPFPEGTVLQKLLRHQGDEAPDPRDIRPDLPDAICHVTSKLLSKNPQDRYQNPLELSAELLMISDELNLRHPARSGSVVMTAAPPDSSWSARHLPWIVPAVLLVVVALIVQYVSSGRPDLMPARPAIPEHGAPDAKHARLDGGDVAARQDEDAPDAGDSAAPDAATDGGGLQASDGGPSGPGDDGDPSAGVEPNADDGRTGGDDNAVALSTDNGAAPPANGDVTPDADASDGTGSSTPPAPDSAANTVGEGDEPSVDVPLVVDGKGGEASTYATLAEACRAAASGHVIELNYDGRLPEPEQPILLSQRKLTIRARDGVQPVIRFRPQGPDRVLYPRSMISVAGGELTLANVHLELEIPVQARSEDWTLFEAVLAEKIRLVRCTLTIRNAADDLTARYRNVSFFHIKSPPRRERTISSVGGEPVARMSIELRNCIARGEAVFLRGNALFAVHLQWENGLLATTERFAEIDAQASALPEDHRLEIDLQHVTALTGGGFVWMASRDDERWLAPVRTDCTDSILITNEAPLLEQSGPGLIEDYRKLIHWNADRSFYEHLNVFWRIDSIRSTMVEDWDWAQWQEHWGPGRERVDRPLPVLWSSFPDHDSAVSNHAPKDYKLADAENNPARAAATDGVSDAGFQAEFLPSLPADPSDAPAVESPAEIVPTVRP